MSDPLLAVEELEKVYERRRGFLGRKTTDVRAVDGVSFELREGEALGLVGESGCGKSTVATSLLRVEEPTGGSVRFDGEDVTEYDADELRAFRRRAAMVFQDPEDSFNPRMTVGEAVEEPLVVHGLDDADRRRAIAEDALEHVGLSADDHGRYPHELSGGQKQRVALARALVLNPDLLVADEPVSALDVSVQADVLSLMERLQDRFDLGVLFISHDMGVVREFCDRVAVMYLGRVVEVGPVEEVFADPQHPYTEALVASVPTPDPDASRDGEPLSGEVPDPSRQPDGCHFHPRCPAVIQPDGTDLPREDWRAVMDLRVALRNGGVDVEGVRNAVAARDGHADGSVPDDRLRAAVRAEYGVPEELPDPDAESTVAAALSDVVDGEQARARERLADAFESVCEREDPTLGATAAGHPAACHRVDD